MVEKTLSDLFLAQVKDVYYSEKKIFRTLPKMAKAAKLPELRQAFATHREETQGQIERLEQVFEMTGKRPQAKPCEAINGIVAEGEIGIFNRSYYEEVLPVTHMGADPSRALAPSSKDRTANQIERQATSAVLPMVPSGRAHR